MEPLQPETDEIADGIFRIATLVPDAAPGGFTFNQFLLLAEEPFLYHTGPRGLFPHVAEAVERVLPVESLRWISFGHVEADECGSMNMWLAAAPAAQIAFNVLGCLVSLNDLADRPPRMWNDGEVLELGGKRVRLVATPPVPHTWEAQVVYEETTRTLLCGDLLTQTGAGPAVSGDDLVPAAMEAEGMFRATSLTVTTAATIRSLGELRPETLAVMHGSSFAGDGRAALRSLADAYEKLVAAV
jgi:flavorubredoxin